ncbi:hypothetical protein QE152_g5071 [Popillia japonica]|uniref:Ribosomal protein L20 n=1 Tax=Popillia japonica TaxID=7064 RepID=A0AAW1MYA2_POPJA
MRSGLSLCDQRRVPNRNSSIVRHVWVRIYRSVCDGGRLYNDERNISNRNKHDEIYAQRISINKKVAACLLTVKPIYQ